MERIEDNRRRRFREISKERFWENLQKPVDCWLFDGAREINGYGYLVNPLEDGPKFITAHRLAWILKNGAIPDGMLVLHKCDIRACCNPDHLFLGTNKENSDDKYRKGRGCGGSRNMHAKLTEEQAMEILRTKPRGKAAKALAAQLGVRVNTIEAVIARRSWKYLNVTD